MEEICRLKNEVTECRFDALNASRIDMARSKPFSYGENELLYRFPNLQMETSMTELLLIHPPRSEYSQTEELSNEQILKTQKVCILTKFEFIFVI